MAGTRLDRSGRFLLLTLGLPFGGAILTTFALVLLVGNRFPRDIAPGSSLALPGLATALLFGALVVRRARRDWPQDQARKAALMFTALSSLLAWPVWTVGVLPSVNGLRLGPPESSTMRLTGLDLTYGKHRRTPYYWARLEPQDPGSKLGEGRYFIPMEQHQTWSRTQPGTVRVTHARGLLGAEIVRDFR